MNNLDLWFHIPGFNGYQINPYKKEIRSMKMMFRDPGHILKPKSANTIDKTFELTSDNGKRVRVKYSKLYECTFKNPVFKPQPVDSNSTYLGARQRTYTTHHQLSLDKKYSKATRIDLSKNIVHEYEPISFYD